MIECAFGRLKARFRILHRSVDVNLHDATFLIYSCFALHNYCEIKNKYLSEQAIKTAIEVERKGQPPPSRDLPNRLHDGKVIKEVFKEYFE